MQDAQAAYRRMMGQRGETVIMRRYTGSDYPRTATDAAVTAVVAANDQAQLAGSLQQGERRLIVLAEDLAAASWPEPPRKNDKVVVRGKELNIEAVDDNSRRIAGQLLAYELVVVG